MFDKKGLIVIEDDGKIDEDTLMMDAIEAGADDFVHEDEAFEIITQPSTFSNVRIALEKKGYNFVQAEVTMIPQSYVSLNNAEDKEKLEKLFDALDVNDDVMEVYHNYSEE